MGMHLTALELKKWAEEHCEEHNEEHITNLVVADRTIYSYYFSWGGFTYELVMDWRENEIENIYYAKKCMSNKMFDLRLDLEDLAIVDGKLFVSAIPRQYY